MRTTKLTMIVPIVAALAAPGPAWSDDGTRDSDWVCYVFNPNQSPVRNHFCAHMDVAEPYAGSDADRPSAPPAKLVRRCTLKGSLGGGSKTKRTTRAGKRVTCKVKLRDPRRARFARAQLVRACRSVATGYVASSGLVTLTARPGRRLSTGAHTLAVTERLSERRVVTRLSVRVVR